MSRVLIREMTSRVTQQGVSVSQAVYTARVVLPMLLATCRISAVFDYEVTTELKYFSIGRLFLFDETHQRCTAPSASNASSGGPMKLRNISLWSWVLVSLDL
ncbi:unnamed protein product [Arctogadus glacialis]